MGKGWTVRIGHAHKGASIQDSGVRIQNGQLWDEGPPPPRLRRASCPGSKQPPGPATGGQAPARAYMAAGSRAGIGSSTLWKTGAGCFHSVEKMGSIFT